MSRLMGATCTKSLKNAGIRARFNHEDEGFTSHQTAVLPALWVLTP
jgi:hypothetical protein